MKNHYTPIRMAKSLNTDNTKCQLGCGAIVLIHCWRECKTGTATLEDILAASYTTKLTFII